MRTAASASLCFYCHLLLSAITGTSSANLHSPETALAGAIRILDGGFGSDDGASGGACALVFHRVNRSLFVDYDASSAASDSAGVFLFNSGVEAGGGVSELRHQSRCATVVTTLGSVSLASSELHHTFNKRIVALHDMKDGEEEVWPSLSGDAEEPFLAVKSGGLQPDKHQIRVVCPGRTIELASPGQIDSTPVHVHPSVAFLVRACNTDNYYAVKGSMDVESVLPMPPLYRFGSLGQISDGIAVRIIEAVAQHLGIKELKFRPILFIVDMSSVGLREGSMVVTFPLPQCRVEGGLLYEDDAVVATLAPMPLPRFKNLAYPFQNRVWEVTLGSLLVVLACTWVISKWSKQSIKDNLWDVLAIFLVEHRNAYLENTFGPQKILNTLWMIACFLLVLGYQGNLKASLVTRPYSKPIRRLIEVVERDMTIYSAESYDGNGEKYTPTVAALMEQSRKKDAVYNLTKPQDGIDVFERVGRESNSAMFVTASFLMMYQEQAVRERERMRYRAIDESYSNNNYLCKPKYRWWRGEDQMFDLVTRMEESGVKKYLWSRLFPFSHLVGKEAGDVEVSAAGDALELETLYVALGAWTLALAAALGVLLLEIRRRNKKKRLN